MRLSEAIRLGSMLRPKVNGFFFRHGNSCAQGAALEACGIAYDDSDDQVRFHTTVRRLWPWIYEAKAGCPAGCGLTDYPVAALLPHLNNHGHDWTRERIADWLTTIEPADEPHAQAPATNAVDPQVEVLESGTRA